MALTDVAIKNAKAREKPYKMGDAGGLFLLVQPSGGKLWRLKYRVDGREKKLGIGTYPEVSLAEARKRRDDARELLAAGKDPSREKQRDKVRSRLQADNTFTAIAREFCDKRKRDGDKAWSTATAKRSEYLLSLLDRSIGRMAINEVEPPDVQRECEVHRAYRAIHGAEARLRVLSKYVRTPTRQRLVSRITRKHMLIDEELDRMAGRLWSS